MRRNNNEENYWISFSDVMTGLMIVFMFIAIAYILETKSKQQSIESIVEGYKQSKRLMHEDLDSLVSNDFKNSDIEISEDLSVQFTNPDVLFTAGSPELSKSFEDILDEFLPKYLELITEEKYRDNISEIRIEGHTDPTPAKYDRDPYLSNIILSQKRATNVLEYIRDSKTYKTLEKEDKKRLEFLLTANGLSYGRALDKNKDFAYKSNLDIDKSLSRRVEFRIVTTSEKIVEDVLNKIEN